MEEDHSIWEIIFPYDYVSNCPEQGLFVAHPNEMGQYGVPYTGEITISSYIDMQKAYHFDLIINELKFISEFGNNKIIPVPEKMDVAHAFRWFEKDNRYSFLDYQPTIFQSRYKLVTFCASSMNWDGLENLRILTVNLFENTVHAQLWDDEWTAELEKKIPAEFDHTDWSRNNLQIYLNSTGTELIANSSFDQLDVIIHLRWAKRRWALKSVNLKTLDSYMSNLGFTIEKID